MPSKIEILEQQEVFNRFIFKIEEAKLRHEKYDGTMTEEMTRLNLDRSDSVAAVIHRVDDDTLVLTEQFRYPTHEKGPGWLVELPAGMVCDGENPTDSMRRELVEEIGYSVLKLHPIQTFYVSPGGSSERIHLFYARVRASDKTAAGGGVEAETEDIRTIYTPLSQLDTLLHRYADAKTIIGIQWLLMNRERLDTF